MLSDDEIKTNAATLKRLLLAEPLADAAIVHTIVDTITSLILAFHQIARADMFKATP